MPKKSPFKVKRYVYRRRTGGEFATDPHAAYFSRFLEEAHIFVAPPETTVALEPVAVTVVLEGHDVGSTE